MHANQYNELTMGQLTQIERLLRMNEEAFGEGHNVHDRVCGLKHALQHVIIIEFDANHTALIAANLLQIPALLLRSSLFIGEERSLRVSSGHILQVSQNELQITGRQIIKGLG